MDTPVESLLSTALMTPMDDPNKEGCRWGSPILIWGPPGIGKSNRIEQAGAAAGLEVSTLLLATMQPEDIGGIPHPDGEGGLKMYLADIGVQALIKAKRGVLFLDELTCARPGVQGAGLGVVWSRKVAGQRMPGGVRVVGAANPPEEAAGGWSLSLPMANRFMHFGITEADVDAWASWFFGENATAALTVEEGEALIRSRWNDVFPRYKGLFVGFMKAMGKDMLLNIPAEGHADRGRAWRSPRSWVMAARAAATCDILDRKGSILELIGACVGATPASEWAQWLAKADMPDPEKMLKDGWTPDKRRLDICFAAYGQAVAWALAKTNKDERAHWAARAYVLLTDGWKTHGLVDIVGASTLPLVKAGYHTHHSPAMALVSRDLLGKLGDKFVDYIGKP
jgi:hypothetical protein